MISKEQIQYLLRLKSYGLSSEDIKKITSLSDYKQNQIIGKNIKIEANKLLKFTCGAVDHKEKRKPTYFIRLPLNWGRLQIEDRIFIDLEIRNIEKQHIVIKAKQGIEFEFSFSRNSSGYKCYVNLSDYPHLKPLFKTFNNREFILDPEQNSVNNDNEMLFFPFSHFIDRLKVDYSILYM